MLRTIKDGRHKKKMTKKSQENARLIPIQQAKRRKPKGQHNQRKKNNATIRLLSLNIIIPLLVEYLRKKKQFFVGAVNT